MKLTEFPCKRVTVFLDACFTGGARNVGLLTSRGVKIKPKEELLKGNLIIFTSSSGDQSSLSYKDKQHGMFTYFLLKRLQETKGEISYYELAKYVKENVSLESILVNSKEQNSETIISPDLQNIWMDFKLK